jgi:hypothetical protein
MESLTMLYQVLGLSSACDIQMDLFKISKLGPVHMAISNLKELIYLKLMPQLSYGQQYCPMDNNIVLWTTIRQTFILEILLGLKLRQGNVLCTFLHGELEPDENVNVEMPLGFSQYAKDGTKKVLKLNKTLYGL